MNNNSEQSLKKTPLHAAHLRAGAKMVPFGGWDMPVQYSGLKAEHQAVRENVGVFDVSHMGQFRFEGPDALKFLQYVTANDVSKIKPGRAHYNWLPNDKGGLVDDIYIYRAGEEDFLMVVNASNIDKDWAHLNKLAKDYNVKLTNESDQWGLLAIQGPKAAETLAPHATPDLVAPKKNAFFKGTLFGFDVWYARTGYTGEDGYEVFAKHDEVEAIWDKVLGIGILPAGLGARDTLRLEAGFPLYGHEFSDEIHPLSTHYTWVDKPKAHHGRAGFDKATDKQLIGLKLDKVPVREGYPVKQGGKVVGHVTSGTTSPTLGYPIAMALIDKAAADAQTFEVEVRGKDQSATRIDIPFYKQA